MNWRAPRAVFAMFVFTLPALSQEMTLEKSNQAIPLLQRELRTGSPALSSSGYESHLRCDASGAVYFRRFEQGLLNSIAIYKIDPVKGTTTKFSPKGSSENLVGLGWTVSPSGEVYSAVLDSTRLSESHLKHPDLLIVRFQADGTEVARFKVDEYFSPTHLAVFGTGEIFLSGRKSVMQGDGSSPYDLPYSAIFSSTGQKLKEVQFEADLKLKQEAEQFASGHPHEVFGAGGKYRSIDLGTARAGTDGLVYLLRRDSQAVLYAINPAGEVVRRFDVEAPEAGLSAFTFQVGERRIAVEFEDIENHKSPTSIQLFDSNTGNPTDLFQSEIRGALGCFSQPNQFSFLSSKEGKFAVATVSP